MIHIFYAEDDLSIGQAVKEYPEQKDCRVSVFPSVKEMKQAVKNRLPDLALIDDALYDAEARSARARTLDARGKNYPKHIQEIAQNQLRETNEAELVIQ